MKTMGLQLPDLCRDLGLDLVRIEPSRKGAQRDGTKPFVKSRVSSPQQAAHATGVNQRLPIHQHDVTADAPAVTGLGELCGLFEGGRIGHQGGGSDDPVCMCFSNGAIHTSRKPKIIRVDNEPPHANSLAGSAGSFGTKDVFS